MFSGSLIILSSTTTVEDTKTRRNHRPHRRTTLNLVSSLSLEQKRNEIGYYIHLTDSYRAEEPWWLVVVFSSRAELQPDQTPSQTKRKITLHILYRTGLGIVWQQKANNNHFSSRSTNFAFQCSGSSLPPPHPLKSHWALPYARNSRQRHNEKRRRLFREC